MADFGAAFGSVSPYLTSIMGMVAEKVAADKRRKEALNDYARQLDVSEANKLGNKINAGAPASAALYKRQVDRNSALDFSKYAGIIDKGIGGLSKAASTTASKPQTVAKPLAAQPQPAPVAKPVAATEEPKKWDPAEPPPVPDDMKGASDSDLLDPWKSPTYDLTPPAPEDKQPSLSDSLLTRGDDSPLSYNPQPPTPAASGYDLTPPEPATNRVDLPEVSITSGASIPEPSTYNPEPPAPSGDDYQSPFEDDEYDPYNSFSGW